MRQSLDYIRTLDPAIAEIVRACYAVAVQWAFIPVALLATGALVSSIFIKEKKLEGR